jgi:hypothetical protein
MALKSKLQNLLDRLHTLREGQVGAIVTNRELSQLDILGISDTDTRARAEWLCKQLRFPCEAKQSATSNQWTFSRPTKREKGL